MKSPATGLISNLCFIPIILLISVLELYVIEENDLKARTLTVVRYIWHATPSRCRDVPCLIDSRRLWPGDKCVIIIHEIRAHRRITITTIKLPASGYNPSEIAGPGTHGEIENNAILTVCRVPDGLEKVS